MQRIPNSGRYPASSITCVIVGAPDSLTQSLLPVGPPITSSIRSSLSYVWTVYVDETSISFRVQTPAGRISEEELQP